MGATGRLPKGRDTDVLYCLYFLEERFDRLNKHPSFCDYVSYLQTQNSSQKKKELARSVSSQANEYSISYSFDNDAGTDAGNLLCNQMT